jgi:hypothetical protein
VKRQLVKRLPILLPALAVVLAVFAMERAATPKVGTRAVVVELFTSQGCSSCPPADELLHQIARDPRLEGKVIPLAFHVDYWNSLGWRDPFSSHEWSERQGAYVRALKLAGAYTPQVVVNGTRQMVGSNRAEIYGAIEEDSKLPNEGTITIAAAAGGYVVRATSPHEYADLVIVTFENGATTPVTSGENHGKTLASDAIVRTLVRATSTPGSSSIERKIEVPASLGIAAFLQDRTTRRIWSATAVMPRG